MHGQKILATLDFIVRVDFADDPHRPPLPVNETDHMIQVENMIKEQRRKAMIKPESIKDEKTNYDKLLNCWGQISCFYVIFHKDALKSCRMGFRSTLLQ